MLPLKGKSLRLSLTAAMGLFLVVLIDVQPSHAQFLDRSESYFKSVLGDGSSLVISLVFFLLRGFFLYYVGFALIETVRSIRSGECDWGEIICKPLMAIALVVVAYLPPSHSGNQAPAPVTPRPLKPDDPIPKD